MGARLMDRYIKEIFEIPEVDLRTYSPLTLAYIGDGIFDLIIRSVVVGKGNTKASNLHKRTSRIVKAETQAKLVEAIKESLTEEEHDIYKRGRNAKSFTMAKNASMSDYRKATGFEALAGYLYLSDRTERLVELTKEGLQKLELL
ncbi:MULTISPECIES: Mini-ribonuclease 3 [Agathobacter]|uniref:Mini-ribonuclease 3 n=1 Tax=Agathobacter ruminis TaxID=1712665 RepID=A0A2G3E2W5_9FIRM|nr:MULTISPECIES: ribonuclease III domain-containing protein [Agathobacter]MBQ1681848.1 ribonuclease III [Agathobacter sp.]MDC7300914.1 ribonuclease III [Agathobacter ruminis]PHU37443.1 ribonuclease III [Agathobacter ruminis]